MYNEAHERISKTGYAVLCYSEPGRNGARTAQHLHRAIITDVPYGVGGVICQTAAMASQFSRQ